jgi:hypothetical protein
VSNVVHRDFPIGRGRLRGWPDLARLMMALRRSGCTRRWRRDAQSAERPGREALRSAYDLDFWPTFGRALRTCSPPGDVHYSLW